MVESILKDENIINRCAIVYWGSPLKLSDKVFEVRIVSDDGDFAVLIDTEKCRANEILYYDSYYNLWIDNTDETNKYIVDYEEIYCKVNYNSNREVLKKFIKNGPKLDISIAAKVHNIKEDENGTTFSLISDNDEYLECIIPSEIKMDQEIMQNKKYQVNGLLTASKLYVYNIERVPFDSAIIRDNGDLYIRYVGKAKFYKASSCDKKLFNFKIIDGLNEMDAVIDSHSIKSDFEILDDGAEYEFLCRLEKMGVCVKKINKINQK